MPAIATKVPATWLARRRSAPRSRRRASSGIETKRMKRNGPTPSVSSRYLTNAKLTPQSTIVTSAAMSDQRAWDICPQSKIPPPMKFETPLGARAAVQALASSKIRELYNEGLGRKDILAFWVGEPDEPTPEFIRKAGTDSIGAGELFYTHNLGIPKLREAL